MNLRNWNTVELKSLADINPESINGRQGNPTINYIDISSVGEGVLQEVSSYRLSDAPGRAKRVLREGDIILSTVRPNRRSFWYVRDIDEDTIASTGFAVLRATKTESRFLYYLISTQDFTKYLTSRAKGAAYPAVDTETISSAKVKIPTLGIQKKIAGILGAYDDLIENNTKRIKILEEMAQAIYKEWFIDFKFPGHKKSSQGKVPQEWTKQKLGTLVQVYRGKSYSSSDLDAGSGGKALPFLTLKSIERDGGFKRSGTKDFFGDYKETHIAKPEDIIIGMTDMTQERRIVGRVARVPHNWYDKYIYSMDLSLIKPNNSDIKEFLYATLRYSKFPDVIKQFANGANVLHLSPSSIENYKLLIPPMDLAKKFSALIKPLYELIDVLSLQSDNLQASRDLLLPKLISGEIDVEKMDIKI